MSYYTKADVQKYIEDSNNKIESRGHKPMTPIEQSLMQISNEEDVVGFFWMDIDENDEGAKVKIDGKTFIRIDLDLYTDDRFAIDLYQSQIESITVSEVIKNRQDIKERAQINIEGNKAMLEDRISDGLQKKTK